MHEVSVSIAICHCFLKGENDTFIVVLTVSRLRDTLPFKCYIPKIVYTAYCSLFSVHYILYAIRIKCDVSFTLCKASFYGGHQSSSFFFDWQLSGVTSFTLCWNLKSHAVLFFWYERWTFHLVAVTTPLEIISWTRFRFVCRLGRLTQILHPHINIHTDYVFNFIFSLFNISMKKMNEKK